MQIQDIKHLIIVWFVNVVAWSLAWLPILQAVSFFLAIIYTSMNIYNRISKFFKSNKDEKKHF
jgi:hypothetical protein